MGYDIYYKTNLKIPKDRMIEADKIIMKFIREKLDDDYVPGLQDTGGPKCVDLNLFDADYDEIVECNTCIMPKDYMPLDYSHNYLLTERILKPLIDELKKENIPVNGYCMVDWDSVEYWTDFWVNGTYDSFDIDNMVNYIFDKLKEKYQ